MNEFKPQVEAPIAPRPAAQTANRQLEWLTKPLVLGLSLTWLVGVLIVVLAAGWYLFAPEKNTAINQLAFDGGAMQPVADDPKPKGSGRIATNAGFEMSEPPLGVMEAIGAVRSHSEANRTAIERMVENYKVEAKNAASLQQQVGELQAQLSLLSGRLSVVEGRSGTAAAAHPKAGSKPKTTVAKSSPISDMRLSAVQTGMAWINWQNQTWAVQEGDSIGGVTVTGIDANPRQVRTTAGTIK